MIESPAETLSAVRADIDRIDAAMHALLIERGTLIDRVIAAKARAGGGPAFRPDREAAMMRGLAERHQGRLPLDTVEGIWRTIISTFTFVQSAYAVHADISAGDAAMRDTARFHFGFTVPLAPHAGPKAVIRAVAAAAGDLGLVRLDGGAAAGPWWTLLTRPEAPKIIARLPFVERPDHPAGLPVFVVARPSAVTQAREVVVYAVSADRWRPTLPRALAALGGEVLDEVADDFGLALLAAVPGAVEPAVVERALSAEPGDTRVAEVGSHAARFGVPARLAAV